MIHIYKLVSILWTMQDPYVLVNIWILQAPCVQINELQYMDFTGSNCMRLAPVYGSCKNHMFNRLYSNI